jgi:hypothetical protein
MTYKIYEDELDSPNKNILSRFENVPALRKADVKINELLGGHPETISARVGREQHISPFAKAVAETLDSIDPGHTERAVANSPITRGYVPFKEPTLQPEEPAPETIGQKLLYTPARMARMGLKGFTGLSSMVSDLPFQLANAAGANAELPSVAQQKLMDKYLPAPTDTTGKIAEFIGSMVAGTGDPISRGLQAATAAKVPAGFGAAQATAKAQVAKELHDANYILPPSLVDSGFVPRTAEGIAGAGRTNELMKYANQETTKNLAVKALKLPPDTKLTAEVLSQQADDIIRTGYEPVKQAGTITTGRVYRQALDAIEQKFMQKSFPAADKQEVAKLIDAYRVSGYQADDAVKKISLLRREAGDAFKPGGDSTIGLAKRELAKALEDNIELNLQARANRYTAMLTQTGARNVKLKGPSPVEILDNYRSARKDLAMNYAVERMLVDKSSGIPSTTKAHAMLQRGEPLTDELLTIAKAGSPLFRKATGEATGGAPGQFNPHDFTMMALGGLAAPVTGGYSSVLTGVPIAQAGIRKTLMSKPMQNMLIKGKPPSGSIFGTPVGGRAAFGVPAQLLPLFSAGEE